MQKKSEEIKTDDLSQKSIRELRKIGQIIDTKAVTIQEKLGVLEDIVRIVGLGEIPNEDNLSVSAKKTFGEERLKSSKDIQEEKIYYTKKFEEGNQKENPSTKDENYSGLTENERVKKYFRTTSFSANNVNHLEDNEPLYEKGNNLLMKSSSLYEKSNVFVNESILNEDDKNSKSSNKGVEGFKRREYDLNSVVEENEKPEFLTHKDGFGKENKFSDYAEIERNFYNTLESIKSETERGGKIEFLPIFDANNLKSLTGEYELLDFLDYSSLENLDSNQKVLEKIKFITPHKRLTVSSEVDLITPIVKGSRTLVCDKQDALNSLGQDIVARIKENYPDMKIFSIVGFNLYSTEYSKIESLSVKSMLGEADFENLDCGFEKMKENFGDVIVNGENAVFYLPSDSFIKTMKNGERWVEKFVDLLQFCGAYENDASITAIINVGSEILIPRIQDFVTNLIVTKPEQTKYRIEMQKSYTLLKESFLTKTELVWREKIPQNWDALSDGEKEKFLGCK